MQPLIRIVVWGVVLSTSGSLVAQDFIFDRWRQPARLSSIIGADRPRSVLRGQDSVYDEPLVTDRPDFTEASSTVGRHVAQIEMGYTFVYDDNNADGTIRRDHNTPEILLRYGMTDNVELRLFWNYVWERTIDAGAATTIDGAEDFAVGTKIDLFSEYGGRPESAVIVEFGVPTGGSSFSTDHLEIGVNFLYSWSLPLDWSLAGSTGYSTSAELATVTVPPATVLEFNDRHNVWHQSITLGVPITDRFGFYFEYFGLFTDGLAADFPAHFIDGGFTYLLNNDTQFDIRAGHGINDAADDLFGGIGLSKRF